MAMTKTETRERYDYDIPGVVEDILGTDYEVTTVMFTTRHATEERPMNTTITFWGFRLNKDGTRAANAAFNAIMLDASTRDRLEFGFLYELGRA